MQQNKYYFFLKECKTGLESILIIHSEECEKCAFYDPCDKEVPCCFEDSIIKCSILKEYLDDLKFKKEMKING